MSFSETTAALLDLEHLNRFSYNPKGLHELIDAFLATTEPILHELDHALQRQNEPEFRQILHALSGAAKSAGAKAVAETCQELVHQRGLEQRLASVEKLNSDFQQTRAALVDFLAELPAGTEVSRRGLAAKRTILVVEDNPTARTSLQIALSDCYQLLMAENGTAALALCEGETLPDAAIIDLNLGRSEQNALSGLEVIQRIKKVIPAIVLTVDRSRDSMHAAVRAGAWAYLIKPPDPDILYATLEAVIAQAGDANDRNANGVLNIATGLMMAAHHLDPPEARRLIATLAMAQRRKTTDLAEEIVAGQSFQNTLARAAQRLSEPTDSPPS